MKSKGYSEHDKKGDAELREDLKAGMGDMLDEHGVFDGGRSKDAKKKSVKKKPATKAKKKKSAKRTKK